MNKCIGNNIEAWRKHASMSQSELAVRSGCSQNAISKCERGKFQLTISLAISIANALGIRLEQMIFHSPTEPGMDQWTLSDDETRIIELYRQCTEDDQRQLVLYIINGLAEGMKP